ncbi:MAG: thiamine phosphate synthase [Brevinematales bacterium]|nr:thiamine phosphate synthase [Brevinematales bacterium]
MTKKEKLDLFYSNQIYCITAEEYSRGRTNIQVVREMLEAGIKIIQYREKKKKGIYRYNEAKEIRKMTKDYGALLIINDYVDLAMMVEADGVHIGHEDYPADEVRKLVGDDMIIGGSTHWDYQMMDMIKKGVDYIGAGPLFETHTKEDVLPPVGLDYLKFALKYSTVPVVAIGGIKEHNIHEVIKLGARCVCIVTDITMAEDIKGKIKRLYEIWDKYKEEISPPIV